MTEPTGLDLDAIERRHRAATPGPWHSWVEGRDGSGGDTFIQRDGPDLYLSQDKEGGGVEIPSPADHDFIAGAYQDIVALVQEVRRLRRNEDVLDLLRSWRDTDLPMVEAIGDTLQHWQRVDKRWSGLAAHTRKSMLEALGTVTAALVHDRPYRPDFADLYRALVRYGLAPGSRSEARPPAVAQVLRWLESASVPMMALEDEDLVECALVAISLRLDGKAAAATVTRRKRAVFYNVLDVAVTGKNRILTRNPLVTMRWAPPEAAEKVDRRVVVNPGQVRELLAALTYIGGRDRDRGRRLVAMFGCMYYAALRPAEALNLREPDCELPASGWVASTCPRRRPRSASATPTAVPCTTARASNTGLIMRSGLCRSRPN